MLYQSISYYIIVEVATAVLGDAAVLFLDEPTSGASTLSRIHSSYKYNDHIHMTVINRYYYYYYHYYHYYY